MNCALLHFGIKEQQNWFFFDDNGDQLEKIDTGNAYYRSLDYILIGNNAKEPKYKDLIKLPKRAVMYLGRLDHFTEHF